MINRIELILKTQNLTPTQFADAIGIQRSSMSHILARRNNPSLDFVMKLLNRFPEISSEWLLTGKGQMLNLGASLPSATLFQPPDLEPETPEFELNKETKFTPAQSSQNQTSVEPQKNLPPLPIEASPEHEKTPPATKRDFNQNSDIERIIVFFADGTFRSYT